MRIPFFTENRSSVQTKEHASQSILPKHPLTLTQEEAAYFTILNSHDRMRSENTVKEHFLTISKTPPIYHLFLQCHQRRGDRPFSCWQLTKRFIERLNWPYLSWNCNATWDRDLFNRTFKEYNHFSIIYAIKPFKVSSPLIPFSSNLVL